MTVQDLREMLRERAETPPRGNPRRHDQVRARVRRTRLRRRLAAGVAVTAAVVAGMSLLPGLRESPRETAVAARPVPPLPETFTAPDGTEYRLLATATLTKDGAEKKSITIPYSGKPLDVAGLCDGGPGIVTPRIRVNGESPAASRGLGPCFEGGEMEPGPLVVPEGATDVTVEFDTAVRGSACAIRTKGDPCVPSGPRWGDWRVGVYEWTPPGRPVDPGAVRDFPRRLGGMRLTGTVSGLGEDEFTLTATSPTGKLGVEQLCAGDLSRRTWFTFTIDGEALPSGGNCVVWKEGPFPMAMAELQVPKGRRVTIHGKVGVTGGAPNRPVRWSVGVYVK